MHTAGTLSSLILYGFCEAGSRVIFFLLLSESSSRSNWDNADSGMLHQLLMQPQSCSAFHLPSETEFSLRLFLFMMGDPHSAPKGKGKLGMRVGGGVSQTEKTRNAIRLGTKFSNPPYLSKPPHLYPLPSIQWHDCHGIPPDIGSGHINWRWLLPHMPLTQEKCHDRHCIHYSSACAVVSARERWMKHVGLAPFVNVMITLGMRWQ